jgi:hypothetical protein
MMNKIFYAALMLVGCSFAFTIPNGECQNFTLFNATDNSTLNETICAGNATIIYNVTNVTNLTVVQCNATNATLWANSTGTFNNATISCLFNVTPPITCTNTTTYVNVSVPIPTNYCNQNTSRTLGYLEVYRNDVCNITIISPANATPSCPACLPYQYYTPCETCRTCETCPSCPAPVECAPPRICETPDVIRLAFLENDTIEKGKSINNLTELLASKEIIMASQRDALNTLDVSIDRKVEAKTGNVNDMYGYALVAGLCCTVFFVYKSRQPQGTPLAGSGIGAAITKERLDELRKQRGGNSDGKTVDGKGMEGAA